MCVWSKRVVVCGITRWHCCAHRRLCNFPDFFLLKIFFLRIVSLCPTDAATGNVRVLFILKNDKNNEIYNTLFNFFVDGGVCLG